MNLRHFALLSILSIVPRVVAGAPMEYPAKPIRLIVPFAAGGSTDILARAIGQGLTEQWGQRVIVDNRPGAGGNLGADLVAKARPDGYTLVMGSLGTHATNSILYDTIPYDPLKDFAPITQVAAAPLLLVVHPSVSASSTNALVQLARSRPGELNYASAGYGSSLHLAAELFIDAVGIDMVHIPYKGSAATLPDLLGGRVTVMFGDIPLVLRHVRTGRLRALAVSAAHRVSVLPDVPTIAESGVPGYEAAAWYGVFAPAGTSAEIVMRLNREIVRLLEGADSEAASLGVGCASDWEHSRGAQTPARKGTDQVAQARHERAFHDRSTVGAGEPMAHQMRHARYDVVVIGGGAAGVAAAIAAAKNGAKTLLIDAGPILGGELLSGMSIDGALNAHGEWVVAGVATELFDECAGMNGYIGPVNDWRLIWYVSVDPEVMKIAIVNLLERYDVDVLLYSLLQDTVVDRGRISGVVVANKSGRTLVTAGFFLDCSGDGDLAFQAGAPFEMSDASGDLQPVSLMFRMSGVESEPFLTFVRDHPEYLALGESEVIRRGRTDAECALELYRQGQPSAFFRGNGPFLGDAIRRGEMFPTALIMVMPTSKPRKEVCLNATRISETVDGTRPEAVSRAMSRLMNQVWVCSSFMRKNVPGFETATLAAIAPRVGIRETRRIMGEYVLTGEDVLGGCKRDDVVAKGSHHVDIHQKGTGQIRVPVRAGGSYDIPLGCLIPRGLTNVYVAGRCLSATREGQGSARTMGRCLAMGQAVGTAAALSVAHHYADTRDMPVRGLQDVLRQQGAILDGTH